MHGAILQNPNKVLLVFEHQFLCYSFGSFHYICPLHFLPAVTEFSFLGNLCPVERHYMHILPHIDHQILLLEEKHKVFNPFSNTTMHNRLNHIELFFKVLYLFTYFSSIFKPVLNRFCN